MIRQSVSKTQKPADSTLLSTHHILQRKGINQTDYDTSLINTRNPLATQADKISLLNMEPQFNHDFSNIPTNPAASFPIQTKLKIGQPNDKYEQEADRVAELVMRMPESALSSPIGDTPPDNGNQFGAGTIQRTCKACSEKEGLIHTKTTAAVTPEVTPSISSGIQSLRGGGQPLSRTERDFFEPRFGADFSNVRVHNDTRATGVAQSVNARAFTVGHHVVFGAGEYSSGSIAGRNLFAHELTHVVQQRGNRSGALQRQEVSDTPVETQNHRLGPIRQARANGEAALNRVIQQVTEAVERRDRGEALPVIIINTFARFFPRESLDFLDLLLRRMEIVLNLIPYVPVRRIRSSSIDIAIDPQGFLHMIAIRENTPPARVVETNGKPEYIALYPAWYTNSSLRATRLIHEIFHYSFPSFIRGHPHQTRGDAYAYQGFISILGGLDIGQNVTRPYPEP